MNFNWFGSIINNALKEAMQQEAQRYTANLMNAAHAQQAARSQAEFEIEMEKHRRNSESIVDGECVRVVDDVKLIKGD